MNRTNVEWADLIDSKISQVFSDTSVPAPTTLATLFTALDVADPLANSIDPTNPNMITETTRSSTTIQTATTPRTQPLLGFPPPSHVPGTIYSMLANTNNRNALAQAIDHTLLKPDATPQQIEALCVEAIEYQFKVRVPYPGYSPLDM